MAFIATQGSLCQCTFGVAPSPLVVPPVNRVFVSAPVATIMDNVPMVNILPFGMCSTPANPSVAAATAAALGVLTPMPCIPVVPAPWMSGLPTVMVGSQPVLTTESKAMCMWGGCIGICVPSQVTCTAG